VTPHDRDRAELEQRAQLDDRRADGARGTVQHDRVPGLQVAVILEQPVGDAELFFDSRGGVQRRQLELKGVEGGD
jgi:hypothetical protein